MLQFYLLRLSKENVYCYTAVPSICISWILLNSSFLYCFSKQKLKHLLQSEYTVKCIIFPIYNYHLLANIVANSPVYNHRNGFPGGSDGKESACDMEDLSSIPGLKRSPGEGHGNPLQYSCLENPMDRGAWLATVNRSRRVRHD